MRSFQGHYVPAVSANGHRAVLATFHNYRPSSSYNLEEKPSKFFQGGPRATDNPRIRERMENLEKRGKKFRPEGIKL
jgi:hypothetical protein